MMNYKVRLLFYRVIRIYNSKILPKLPRSLWDKPVLTDADIHHDVELGLKLFSGEKNL